MAVRDSENVAVPPDAMRVWRGFRLPTLPLDDFLERLGTVFVPATVRMQIDVGLQGYVPTVTAGLAGKPDTVPDETAILSWQSQRAYADGFLTLAVRTYTLTHGGVYTPHEPESRADFPAPFDDALPSGAPVYLFGDRTDWMVGNVTHLVGSRPAGQDPASFRTALAEALRQIQHDVPLDGAIACAGDDYVVYWELGMRGDSARGGAGILAELVDWHKVFTPVPTSVEAGLWDDWAGMDVRSGSSFNLQFARKRGPDDESR
jgi:hypothetical protein